MYSVPPELINEITSLLLLAFIGFAVTMLATPVYTFFAYKFKFWKVQRTTATTGEKATVFAKLHAAKHQRNIPTMAGMVFVAVAAVMTLAFNLNRAETWLPLAALVGGGLVGLIDDVINIRGLGGGVKGLRSSVKFLLITLVAATAAWFFYYKLGFTSIHIPYMTTELELGWFIIPIFIFVVVAMGNAVNISDGLDGLAGGLVAIAFGTYGVIAMLQGQSYLAAFCFTVMGTLAAYLWFNIYPARFFMGDVGSFALGTTLGVVAMLTNTLVLLPLIGLIFVIEAGSSSIQILSKKYFGRKIFISAPIHHHLEATGWPETKITMRFWLIAQICAALGLIIFLTGGYM